MLSKSQARLFFLAATAGFSGVFLWLTVDTIRQVPERSNEDNLTEAVVRGKTIWDEKNCMGCHTILGEGAYYAPELTLAYTRRGEAWLKIFLKDPQAMYPGQRKMIQYDFTDEEIDDVISFLKWIGEIDTNGFPAEPDLVIGTAQAAPAASAPAAGNAAAPPVYFSSVCVGCHAVGGVGGVVGPALDGVAGRYTDPELREWLSDPQSVKPGTTMPDLNLSSSDLDAVTAYLMTLK